MAREINPRNDDEARRIASEQIKKQEAERIKALEAVDPDQRAKQQQFRTFMKGTDEEDDNAPSGVQATPSSPSPLQPNFYNKRSIDPSSGLQNPSLDLTIRTSEDGNFEATGEDPYSDEGLPQSSDYYQMTSLPWQSPEFIEDPVDQNTALTQTGPTAQSEKKQTPELTKEKGKPTKGSTPFDQKGGKLDASPFGPPGKSVPSHLSSKGHHGMQPPAQKKQSDEKGSPTSGFWAEQKNQTAAPSLSKNSPNRKITGTTATINDTKTPDVDKKILTNKPFEAVASESTKQGAHEEHKSNKETKKESSESALSQTTNVAPQLQGASDASAVAPAPYMRPEQLAQLFCQTVGTIILTKIPSGISKTEFVLNNPKFANSRFAGATIEVTRYSTAPDALNIRISGSPEAVNAFNQSKDSLMATFQNGYAAGTFKFQITRIDVHQASSRPVFHRKEGRSDQQGQEK